MSLLIKSFNDVLFPTCLGQVESSEKSKIRIEIDFARNLLHGEFFPRAE